MPLPRARMLLVLLPVLLLPPPVAAVVLRPPTPILGFSTWNHFRGDINETVLREVASSMARTGLVDAGYRWLNIDDLWAQYSRTADGRIVEDPSKFPSGMKSLTAHLKSLNMSLGLYTARAERTCSGAMPGSLGHEAADAQAFAAMGAEFLKNDDCGVVYANAAQDYGAMERAIRDLPAPLAMIHSVKAPDLGAEAAPSVCQFRRVGKDLKDTWEDVMRLLDTANDAAFLDQVGPGFFSDLDMLEVGNPEAPCQPRFPGQRCGQLTADEQQAHLSLWAAFKSPLVIGADPRALSSQTLAVLKNAEVLAVNQDALAKPVRLVASSAAPSAEHHQVVAATGIPAGGTDAAASAAPFPAAGTACIGYVVSGAGLAGANGCYRNNGTHQGQPPRFVLDTSHELYSWGGVWRIGQTGQQVDYVAARPTALPPLSGWIAEHGAKPAPTKVFRSDLPPAPPPVPTPEPPAAKGPGIKLKMARCDAQDRRQQFVLDPIPTTAAGQQTGGSNKNGLFIRHVPSSRCATVLAERWPWWVSLLPCNTADTRQAWYQQPNGHLLASKPAVATPWPSGGGKGKCSAGPCPLAACLEVEGANPEVDQCSPKTPAVMHVRTSGWSTNASQFIWSTGTDSAGAKFKSPPPHAADPESGFAVTAAGPLIMNKMSGQCLQMAGSLEVYAGPLSGGRYTAVLLNRSPALANITLSFTSLPGLGAAEDTMLGVRDILSGRDLGGFKGSYSTEVRSHAVVHVVLDPAAY